MSSKRRLRRRQCTSKKRFNSQSEAVAFIKLLIRKRVGRPDLHSYRCDFCGGWHVGRARKELGRRKSIKAWEWNSQV